MKTLRFVALFVGMISLATCEAADPFLTIDGHAGLGKGQHLVFVTGEE